MTLTEELKKRMKEKEYSLTQVSKSLNASSATIHLWLNNKYTGNVEKINDIKIYFTCESLEKKIYATFPEEKEKNKDENGSDSIKNENKINIESINNENIEEKDENIKLSQNI